MIALNRIIKRLVGERFAAAQLLGQCRCALVKLVEAQIQRQTIERVRRAERFFPILGVVSFLRCVEETGTGDGQAVRESAGQHAGADCCREDTLVAYINNPQAGSNSLNA